MNGDVKTLSMVQVNHIRWFAERYLVFNVNMLINKFVNDPALLATLNLWNEKDPDNFRMPTEQEIRDIMVDVLVDSVKGV